VAKLLAEGPGGNYGIHSEMFTTGLMHLHQAGKVKNQKGLYDGFSVTTFALGTPELYEWLDGREEVRFLPVDRVNDPALIARNRNMVSINGALSVDLAGQIVADAIEGRQHSGIGGHEDFVAGAGMARGGHSLVCLPSTATVAGRRVSRIVSQHPAGALVTTPRHQADVIITECGAASLVGLTMGERARALAAIAHPDFRDELRG
jgi:acyl-CoA hydrolase